MNFIIYLGNELKLSQCYGSFEKQEEEILSLKERVEYKLKQ